MFIKIIIFNPYDFIQTSISYIKIEDGLDSNGIIDWVYFNKAKIIKQETKLTEREIERALIENRLNIKNYE